MSYSAAGAALFGLSWLMLTARAGTTVEIACLYTIWVTEVLRNNTTYWSKDST